MDESIEIRKIRKANECISGPGYCGGAPLLFDHFWREGELALMIGPAGAGKSLLAVQIADALARGREMDGFVMAFGRRKVLYVDLAISDRQFGERYTYFSPKAGLPRSYKFAENIYRDRPAATEELCDWLEAVTLDSGFDGVIIDDLSAVKRTHDGIRETLAVMRRLKKLCDERGIAILAIAGCDSPRAGRTVRTDDMGRSRILCTLADSVFALGPATENGDEQCLVQLRVRNKTMFWKERNAPMGSIERLESGLLGFRFDKRFDPYIDKATLALINRIRAMRKGGTTFKAIAAELGISKTRAFDLNGKWIPSMDEREDDEPEENEDCEVRSAEFVGHDESRFSTAINITPSSPEPTRIDSTTTIPQSAIRTPQLLGPERVSIYDLQRGFSRDGEEIFIEVIDQDTGRPRVWYQFDRKGVKIKSTRGNLGTTTTRLGPTEFL